MCNLLFRLPDNLSPFSIGFANDDLLLFFSFEDNVVSLLFFLKQGSIRIMHLAHFRGKLIAASSLLLLILCHPLHDVDLHSMHLMLKTLFTFHSLFAERKWPPGPGLAFVFWN